MKRSLKASAAGLLVAMCGVALAATGDDGANKRTSADVTFNKDVAPIFFRDCAECHRPNDIAPMSLLSYKEARPWARAIREKVISREMPPWSADPRYGEFSNLHRLEQDEIDTIVAWVDQGAREGEQDDLPPAPAFVEGAWRIGKPDAVLTMQEEYTVEVGAPDNYLYFRIPTRFKEDKWVQAAEVRPGNKTVVHHVIAFIQTPEMIARREAARKRGGRASSKKSSGVFYQDGTLRRVKADAPVVDDGCDLKGAEKLRRAGVEEGNVGALLAGYAPGKEVDFWPIGMAKKIPAGSEIVFQMHYSNVFKAVEDKPAKDRTSVGLVFAKEPPAKEIKTFAVANHLFTIPAGAENHEVTACHTFESGVEIISYMPHMHLRGKDMKYEVIYPDGRKQVLLWVPRFNFNWQTMYELEKPVPIPAGTKLVVTAHFDNSKKNKYNPDPARDVRWGDPTYDEMMIGWMDLLVDTEEKRGVSGRAARN